MEKNLQDTAGNRTPMTQLHTCYGSLNAWRTVLTLRASYDDMNPFSTSDAK